MFAIQIPTVFNLGLGEIEGLGFLNGPLASLAELLILFSKVRSARKRNGIEPNLPPEKDRVGIKLKFRETGKIPLTPEG